MSQFHKLSCNDIYKEKVLRQPTKLLVMKNNQVINQGTVSRLLMSLPDKVINQDINKDIMSRLFFKVIHI